MDQRCIRKGGLGSHDVVVMSDAGIKGDGRWGAGWLVVDRERRQILAAGWFGGRGEENGLDINGREAQALERALQLTAMIRAGRMAEVGKADCTGDLTTYRRRKLGELLRKCIP